MMLNGKNFGVFLDRYTGWPGVYSGVIKFDITRFLTRLCEDYMVLVSCTSHDNTNLTAKAVEDMMNAYDIYHRISSVANPHRNARAELVVKTVKRMLRGNVYRTGELNKAKFFRALLQLRYTPDRHTRMLPALASYGRELRGQAER